VPETVDFTKLVKFSELWSSAGVPVDTYTSATITLDYTNAQISVQVNGAPVAVSILDPTGAVPTQIPITVQFDPNNLLTLQPTFATSNALRLAFDFDLSAVELNGYDACFFCLGVSSVGMDAPTYYRLTYELTTSIAATLASLNPGMTFIYVSGASTDSSERGRSMWARVKGRTENALLRLPFVAAYMFRPGIIEPLDGIQSRTAGYRVFYTLAKPLLPLVRWIFPNQILTTRQIGHAMLAVARNGAPKRILETRDIRAVAVS